MHVHVNMCMAHAHAACYTEHNEQVGIQIEEPFSILPLEAFCNGAIEATNKEMLGAVQKGVFEREVEH